MQTVVLTYQQAGLLSGGLATVCAALRVAKPPALKRAAPFVGELAMIGALYALWQLANSLSEVDGVGALSRARWIERTERAWHLPSESSVQHALLGNSFVAQFANLYYATMHFTVLFAFLIWLFVFHRDRYRPVRRVLALTTLACLLIQLIPVAPPRLVPGIGIVDVAAKYHQSVYSGGFGADQLSAMPSVHVAWAVLIGFTTLRLGRGAVRWLGPVHTVITILVVVSTGNHFWADGIVAVAVLAGCAALELAGRRVAMRAADRILPGVASPPELSPAAEQRILR